MKTLGIIGAGAFGTSLAVAFASKFEQVNLYTIENEVVRDINNNAINPKYLKGISLDKSIVATIEPKDLSNDDVILIATPAQYLASTIKEFLKVNNKALYLICSKGLDISSKKLLSQVILDEASSDDNFENQIGVLTGPSFAYEIANFVPTTLLVVMNNLVQAEAIANLLSTKSLRIYYSDDIIGAQIGGSVKNVIAVASGIVKGLSLGHNTFAGLITRGLNEMLAINKFYGGKNETIFGLSGLGDLILTATSEKSRNFSLGYNIGKQGYFSEDLIAKAKGTCEGYYTAKSLHEIIDINNLYMPICSEIFKICYEGKSPQASLAYLMNKSIKIEKFNY